MAAPADTETLSHGERQKEGPCTPQWSSASFPVWHSSCLGSRSPSQPPAMNPTSSSTMKPSHTETVEFPQHFLPFCLLDASDLCLRRLFLIPHYIPEPTATSWEPAASRLLRGRRQPQQRPEEGRHHLHGASGEGIFPRKAAGVCPFPSDIPSKRLL